MYRQFFNNTERVLENFFYISRITISVMLGGIAGQNFNFREKIKACLFTPMSYQNIFDRFLFLLLS
jgi:hypothetical protein